MRILLLTVLLFLTACESRRLHSARDLTVDIVGTDSAYCILSTSKHRYALDAPGTTFVERSDEDLKVDCRDNAIQRRRVMMVEPLKFALGPYYPEVVTVDFSTLDNGSRLNGFRAEGGESKNDVLTEESFSKPVNLQKQSGMVKKTYTTQRKSYRLLPLNE